VKDLTVEAKDDNVRRAAQTRGMSREGVEDGLHIRGGTADEAKDFPRGRLLLPCFLQ
jgi:hypothetical protein